MRPRRDGAGGVTSPGAVWPKGAPVPFSPLASITLHQLRVFLVAARAPSLREAAETLGVTVPTLSEQVRILERVLGVQLLIRSPGRRGIQLTTNGQILVESSQLALSSLEDALARMERTPLPPRSTVELGCGPTFSEMFLPEIYSAFQAEHPDIDVHVAVLGKPHMMERLRRGRLDLGITFAPIDDAHMGVEPLGIGFDLTIFARPDHPLVGRRSVALTELAGEKFVLAPMPSMIRSLVQRRLNDAGVELEVAWEVASPRARMQAVRSGLGITALGVNPNQDDIARFELVALDVRGFPIRCEWVLVSRADGLSPAAECFRTHLLRNASAVVC